MLDFSTFSSTTSNPAIISIVYALLLSFVLGTAIAVVYTMTFQGLSFSKNFLHSIILAPIVVAIVMQAIGNNLAVGIGMVGAVSLLRFRSNVKDPRDMFFLFAGLAVGVACGVHSYSIAVIGTIGFLLAALILAKTPFTQSTQFDGLLRFSLENTTHMQGRLQQILASHCRQFALITLREAAQGQRLDYCYQVKLKEKGSYEDLVARVRELEGIKGVHLLLQEVGVEV